MLALTAQLIFVEPTALIHSCYLLTCPPVIQRFYFLGILLLAGSAARAQTVVASAATPEPRSANTSAAPAFKADSVFINPQVLPSFTGGAAAMMSYLQKNMQYPAQAVRQRVTGRVYVTFVLSATGRVTDAHVMRGPGSGLNEEALRLVWLMPPWQPGQQEGHNVRTVCTIPIAFQL